MHYVCALYLFTYGKYIYIFVKSLNFATDESMVAPWIWFSVLCVCVGILCVTSRTIGIDWSSAWDRIWPPVFFNEKYSYTFKSTYRWIFKGLEAHLDVAFSDQIGFYGSCPLLHMVATQSYQHFQTKNKTAKDWSVDSVFDLAVLLCTTWI